MQETTRIIQLRNASESYSLKSQFVYIDISMEEQILNTCNKCRKMKNESLFSCKLKSCDKCTDNIRQYYKDRISIDYQEIPHVQHVVQRYGVFQKWGVGFVMNLCNAYVWDLVHFFSASS